MKRTTLLGSAGAVILGALSMSASAQSNFIAADDSIGTQICMAITKDSPLKLRNEMKNHHVRKTVVVNKLQCNDLTVRQFASLYGFDRTLKGLGMTPLTETSIHDLAKVHGDTLTVVSGSH
ncbi:DUF3718 domain-containing protein [Pseudoalteromonas sp. GB56]